MRDAPAPRVHLADAVHRGKPGQRPRLRSARTQARHNTDRARGAAQRAPQASQSPRTEDDRTHMEHCGGRVAGIARRGALPRRPGGARTLQPGDRRRQPSAVPEPGHVRPAPACRHPGRHPESAPGCQRGPGQSRRPTCGEPARPDRRTGYARHRGSRSRRQVRCARLDRLADNTGRSEFRRRRDRRRPRRRTAQPRARTGRRDRPQHRCRDGAARAHQGAGRTAGRARSASAQHARRRPPGRSPASKRHHAGRCGRAGAGCCASRAEPVGFAGE